MLLEFRRPILLTLKKITKDKSQNFNSLGDWVGLAPFPSPGAQTMEILALNVIFSREAVKRPPHKSQPDYDTGFVGLLASFRLTCYQRPGVARCRRGLLDKSSQISNLVE